MSKNTLRHAIHAALAEVLGRDVVFPSFYTAKLKDGTRVYRISGTGWGPGTLFKRDGKIWIRPNLSDPNAQPVHVTKEIVDGDYQRDDLPSFWRWEWYLLDKGPERVEQELDKAIHARGVHNIKVEIGGGDSGYPTSMAFKVLGSNRKRLEPPSELALLFYSLPPMGSPWPAERRKRWFETAERIFDLMYGPCIEPDGDDDADRTEWKARR
jgi:hypothetical protein